MNKKMYVVAENYFEYREWVAVHCHDPRSMRYVTDVTNLRGVSEIDIAFVGHFQNRQDWPAIRDELRRNLFQDRWDRI